MSSSTGLEVRDLVVRFGGLTAVDGLNVDAPLGRITALLGPNGAGKTTAFNVCSGLNRPTRGSVHLFGKDVTRTAPEARARMGLGRTFQRMELFDSISVRANVALGLEGRLAGSLPWRQVWGRPGERARVEQATADALAMCGIQRLADRRPSEISTGQRRLVELARVVAGGFRLLLLDEPSSGLDKNETVAFGEVLSRIVADTGAGILIVEHDMSLVMSRSHYIFVLDFGRPIFQGTPAQVRASEIVRSAYLGTEVGV